MFLKKKELEESPLMYWEEKSYMLAIPKNQFRNPMIGLFDRVAYIDGVDIIDKRELSETEPGYIKVRYFNEEYEIEFYPSNFSFHPAYFNGRYYFEKEDIENLKNANNSLTIYMKFSNDVKRSYLLQLKIADAIIPDMIALFDESAETMLPYKWIDMTINSNVLPSSNDLFTVQAVMDKDDKVWLHTHGLCRCGLKELEILDSDKKNYNNHFNLINTYANFLIDGHGNLNGAYIGILQNRMPIVVTSISWTEGIKKYNNLKLGGLNDRNDGHNSKFNTIFIYKSEEDEKNNIISKVSFYDDLWGENPIFFVSNEETDRMKKMAIERFDLVRKYCNEEVLIKIGLDTVDGSKEHIWFKLLEFDNDRFKAKLTQEPYNVSNVHTNDEMWFDVTDVTDWIIYTKDYKITPNNAYILK